MKDELVVKSNSLTESSYTLSITEFRVLQMVFSEISKYENSNAFVPNHEFKVFAKDYANAFNVAIDGAYESLKGASEKLFARYFTYQRIFAKPDHIELVHSRWVSKIGYSKKIGYISLQLSPDVIGMVGKLKECFTQYKIKEISSLTSIYALRLYELVIQWRSAHETPIFEINDFREKLGVPKEEYNRMFDFKKRVLDFAVSQINENTNIYLEYEQHKNGRIIHGFSFKFVEIQDQRDPNTIDWVNGQPDKKPARKKISKAEAQKMARMGESWEELYRRLGKDFHIVD